MIFRWLHSQHVVCWRIGHVNARRGRKGFATSPRQDTQAQTTQDAAKAGLERTRNIGIIAHIDAVRHRRNGFRDNTYDWQGKTTTTERMLYYSGFTRRIGGTVSHISLIANHKRYTIAFSAEHI